MSKPQEVECKDCPYVCATDPSGCPEEQYNAFDCLVSDKKNAKPGPKCPVLRITELENDNASYRDRINELEEASTGHRRTW